jgi:hypothetical protein
MLIVKFRLATVLALQLNQTLHIITLALDKVHC